METINKKAKTLSLTDKIKTTTNYVYKNSKSVKINEEKLIEFFKKIDFKFYEHEVFLNFFHNHLDKIEDHNNITYEQLISFVCVVDSLNFCFWPLEKEYNKQNDNQVFFEYDDYVRNLNNIFIENREFFTAESLSIINIETVKEKIFSNLNFPLLDERTRSLNELGNFIIEKFGGKFQKFLEFYNFDCEKVYFIFNFSDSRRDCFWSKHL